MDQKSFKLEDPKVFDISLAPIATLITELASVQQSELLWFFMNFPNFVIFCLKLIFYLEDERAPHDVGDDEAEGQPDGDVALGVVLGQVLRKM